MIGFGDTVLNLKELLAVDVRPGVLLPVHNALLQRAVNFRKGHFLRAAADGFHLRHKHIRRLNAELQAIGVRRRNQRHVGRHLLHAIVPVGQPLKAAALHRIQKALTGIRSLKGVNRVHVLEHEGQIENAELLGELLEFRQRRRGQLHIALQHGFQNLVVVIQGRVREHFHAGDAVHLVVHTLLQQRRGNPLGVLVGVGHVAELDDDLAIVTGILSGGSCGRGQRKRHRGGGSGQIFHVGSSPVFQDLFRSHAPGGGTWESLA